MRKPKAHPPTQSAPDPALCLAAPTIGARLTLIRHGIEIAKAVAESESTPTEELLNALAHVLVDASESLYWLEQLPPLIRHLLAPNDDDLVAIDRDDIDAAAERVARAHLAPHFNGPSGAALTPNEREIVTVFRSVADVGQSMLLGYARNLNQWNQQYGIMLSTACSGAVKK